MIHLRFGARLLVLGLIAALAACGQNQTQTADAPAGGQTVLNRGTPSEPDSLDHHHTTTTTESAVIGELISTTGAIGIRNSMRSFGRLRVSRTCSGVARFSREPRGWS